MDHFEISDQLEDLINDAEALVRLLLYCTEAADDSDLQRLKPIFNTTLYLAIDKVSAMRDPIENLYREGASA